ncbi:MAG: stage II sporulation protein M [Actinobacteria bacterium]|nr:stage II sporulation protein M [Actinomycetota bacterium]
MDIDRFIAVHEAEWARLADLARRAGSGGKGLEHGEVDELVRRYQRVSLHLSQARTVHQDPGLVRRLSEVVGAAHAAVHGVRVSRFSTVKRFLWSTFPAAVWTCRRQLLASALVFFGTAVVVGLIFWQAPNRIDLVMPRSTQKAYVEKDFVTYYSENPSAVFFSEVTTNNIQVAILAFGLGAVLVVPGVIVLFENGAYLGLVAGLFATRGRFWNTFVVYIAPHGLLELTAITFAGAAGMRVGWAVFAPGDRTRAEALGDEGRRSVTVVLGTALGFLGAGLIEGFVTGSPALPAGVKVAVGVLAVAAFLLWTLGRGRAAAAEGWTGSLEELRPSYIPVDPLAPPAPLPGPVGWVPDPLAPRAALAAAGSVTAAASAAAAAPAAGPEA